MRFDRIGSGPVRATYAIPSSVPTGPVFINGTFYASPGEGGGPVGSIGFAANWTGSALELGTWSPGQGIQLGTPTTDLSQIDLRSTFALSSDPNPGTLQLLGDETAYIGTPFQVSGAIAEHVAGGLAVLPYGVMQYQLSQVGINEPDSIDSNGFLLCDTYGQGSAVVSASWGAYSGEAGVFLAFPPNGNYHVVKSDMSGIAYDPANGLLYGDSQAIDPKNGAIVGQLPKQGATNSSIAISTDGTTLYEGDEWTTQISRVDLKSLESLPAISLGTGSTTNSVTPDPNNIIALLALPSQPNSVVAWVQGSSSSWLAVYDQATARPTTATTTLNMMGLCVDPSGQYCYTDDARNIYRFSIDGQGVHLLNTWAAAAVSGQLYALDGHLFDSVGGVYDAGSGQKLSTLSTGNGGSVAVLFPAIHEILYFGTDTFFDTRTFAQVGTFQEPQSFGSPSGPTYCSSFGAKGLEISFKWSGPLALDGPLLIEDATQPLPSGWRIMAQKSTGRK